MSIAEAHRCMTASGEIFELEQKVIEDRTCSTWKFAPNNLRDIFLDTEKFADRVLMIYEHDAVTYDAFRRATIALAQHLIDDGVQKGDRVAIIMRNLPEWPVAFFAAALVGAIVTPLNARWASAELKYGLIDSGARVIFIDGERLGQISDFVAKAGFVEKVYVARKANGNLPPKTERLEQLIGSVKEWPNLAAKALPDVALGPEDDATILYTSGTSGNPKGALATHRNITTAIWTNSFANARKLVRLGEPGSDSTGVEQAQETTLMVVPLFHVTGLASIFIPTMNSGGKIIFMRRWDAEQALRMIEHHKINHIGGVPTIPWQLIEHPMRRDYDLSSLRTVSYGGAPSAPELPRKIREAFPGVAIGTGWGMTETSASFAGHMGPDYEDHPESVGIAAPVGEMQIRDPADGQTVLPPGMVGELWVKGPQVVKRYWNKPEATAEMFQNGWLRTGDLARIDEEGFLFIIDRIKDMLIRGGENIYCIEVENILYDHPDVIDAAVVGIPHKTLGEEPGAVVHLRTGAFATEEELQTWVGDRAAAFKVPVRISFLPEHLPRNANGKILKSELKRIFADTE
ncbi:class I adenylate-forming enzyme family protein [Sphingomonas sp. Root710]|uniref:class I adenylate-forming enzyme family protein n=1 Tax=Sphingomonas sp. Root710 TaxID=1736594 RepID=UPI001F2622E2|nr:class I adenylate-forming enzyme family protein [Sphingomonas sp. Root710]